MKTFEERLFNLVANVMGSRIGALDDIFDEDRDVEEECRHPKVITTEMYQLMYDRSPIAARVVELFPLECWQVQPQVYEDEDTAEKTEFENAWDSLSASMLGETNFFQQEAGSAIWNYLKRLDIQSGIGCYGLLLIGINDNLPLNKPAAGIEEFNSSPSGQTLEGEEVTTEFTGPYSFSVNEDTTKNRRLLYLRVVPESQVKVLQYEGNFTSPRFGKPVLYRITFFDPKGGVVEGNLKQVTKEVHWTRVIHVGEEMPRMQQVFDNLLDLRKLYGGSAEMYWQGAFPGVSFETHPSLGSNVSVSREEVKEEYEQYRNGLQRAMLLRGLIAKQLSPTVVDPTPQINVHLEAIAIRIGCPMRILKGSERGNLASEQDDDTWNDRIRERENGHITPNLIVPFVNRLILFGVLPRPKQSLKIWWPDLIAQSDEFKASVGEKLTNSLAKYLQSGGENAVTLLDFLTRFLKFTDEEAMAMIQAVADESVTDRSNENDDVATSVSSGNAA